MKEALYAQVSKIEDEHWWFQHRRQLIADAMPPLIQGILEPALLDLGCGTGGNVNFIAKFSKDVVGLEISETALSFARKKYPKQKFQQGDLNDLPKAFPATRFDIVTIFKVLYHQWIKDDVAVLKQVHQVLKPGGYVILTEPAFKILFRNHDIEDFGKTRYVLPEMARNLEQAGFEVTMGTYFNSISFFPALLLSWLEKLQKKDFEKTSGEVAELEMPSPILNKIVYSVLALERIWIRIFRKCPFGVSLLCIARKKD
jgi:SAM-dependent methyltransferase